ncbi:hypothetical protein B0H15DRAFT_803362 [Mycena belliarum]|uniref:Uncharacterized protein n=1 Tax=Mycena belliarum TaxID=1033014 RepID=A0AAD6XL66_9AGAR|nr:hypothetical protein B0H15DRAFT_803362 [Mycena belliae]
MSACLGTQTVLEDAPSTRAGRSGFTSRTEAAALVWTQLPMPARYGAQATVLQRPSAARESKTMVLHASLTGPYAYLSVRSGSDYAGPLWRRCCRVLDSFHTGKPISFISLGVYETRAVHGDISILPKALRRPILGFEEPARTQSNRSASQSDESAHRDERTSEQRANQRATKRASEQTNFDASPPGALGPLKFAALVIVKYIWVRRQALNSSSFVQKHHRLRRIPAILRVSPSPGSRMYEGDGPVGRKACEPP